MMLGKYFNVNIPFRLGWDRLVYYPTINDQNGMSNFTKKKKKKSFSYTRTCPYNQNP